MRLFPPSRPEVVPPIPSFLLRRQVRAKQKLFPATEGKALLSPALSAKDPEIFPLSEAHLRDWNSVGTKQLLQPQLWQLAIQLYNSSPTNSDPNSKTLCRKSATTCSRLLCKVSHSRFLPGLVPPLQQHLQFLCAHRFDTAESRFYQVPKFPFLSKSHGNQGLQ